MEIVYLDNSATTAVCPAAAQKALDMMTRCYGNPSSLHTMGIEAEKEMTAAREALACKLDVPADCIRFTSGGTEANNLAVLGAAAALAHSSRYAVTTAIEHPSVARCFDQLEAQGWTVTRLRPEADGTISAGALLQACRPDTALISMMLVNNETGALLPILSALPAVRRAAPQAVVHCDAVQAFGKIPVPAGRSGIDLLSVSGHKIHAPKGVGALYIRRGVRLHPRMLGGGQENGMRSGTEALPAIAAMGAAVCALPAYDVQQERFSRLYAALLDRLAPELAAGQIVLHRPAAGVRYIVSLSVPGYRSETLLHALAARNVFVSSGSACARGKRSAVLSAMGVPDREIDAALRLSFCADNTGQDVDAFVQALREAMKTVARQRG